MKKNIAYNYIGDYMKHIFLFILIVVNIPIMVINFFYSINISGFVENKINELKEEKPIMIRVLKNDNTVENINLEEYIVGVVSSEEPVYFEDEALKAQAVASRTYALKQMENNKENYYDVTDDVRSQVYSSIDKLKERWGSDFDNNYSRIKKLVNDTKGEYISYNNEIIYAFYFSTSNGYTEDNKDVFGMDLPYLKVVKSDDESETDNFYVTKTFSKEEFFDYLGLDYSNNIEVNNIIRTNSNRIKSITINNITFNGRDFQKKLGLRSNDFEIIDNGDISIITKGFGHGVGLSQYGSNKLAKEQKNYIEILNYYYPGTEIKKS